MVKMDIRVIVVMVSLGTFTPVRVTAVTLMEYCTPDVRSWSVIDEDVVFITCVEV